MNFADLRFWGYLILALAVVLSLRFLVSRICANRLPTFDKLGMLATGISSCSASVG